MSGQGSLSTMLKTVVSGNNTPFTGANFTAYHPISQNWRDSYPKTAVTTTKPTRVQFEITSTLGHLVDKIHGKWTFRVTINKAKLTAYLDAASPDVSPHERIQNIKLLPNQARNMLDQWTILHNSTEAEVKKAWQLERMAREIFTASETDYQHMLSNGHWTGTPKRNQHGGARYIYWNGSSSAGRWDDALPNIPYFGRGTSTRSTYNMKSQHDCLRLRDPETPTEDFYKKYKYHYYHEIGLKDHPAVTTTATTTNITDALFPNSATELVFDFELTYEFQTPWHRNIKDAFAILNCVNHPEFWLYFRKPEEWIQNWSEVSAYADVGVLDFSLLTNYYDIPRQLWDANYPLSQQKNWFTPEFQWHTHDKVITCTGNGNPATNATSVPEIVINVNTIDRVARYFMVTVQANLHYQGGNINRENVFLDIFKNIWLEVNNEKVLTKIQTPVRLYLTKANRYMYNGHEGSSFPGEIYFLPLCIDTSMDNPGGGSVDMHPIYNNVKLHLVVDPSKVEALALSGDPNYAQPQITLPMPDLATPGSTVSTAAPSLASGLTNGAGSTTGAIVITGSTGNYTYTLDAKIQTTALVLDMITFDHGQLYKQGHS
jgi:hypothetical protein